LHGGMVDWKGIDHAPETVDNHAFRDVAGVECDRSQKNFSTNER
jgi:hypothetical protein